MNDSIIPSRRGMFKTATQGLTAWQTAQCLNRMKLSHGIDWRGCKKSELCEEYAAGQLSGASRIQLETAIQEWRATNP